MYRKILLIGMAVLALGLSACGDDDDDDDGGNAQTPATAQEPAPEPATGGTSSGGETVKFSADPSGQLAYEQKEVTAKAGKATIEFTNDSSVPHDVEIEDSAGEDVAETDTIQGSKTTTDADLKPGEYTFYCSVGGHRGAGMEGKLIVK